LDITDGKNDPMNYLIGSLFFVAGIIKFVPLIGVWSSERLSKLYQIEILNQDIALLLRHRAILFGIVGAIIISAAFFTRLRLTAAIAGLVSALSFIVLVLALETTNPSLIQIAWIDLFVSMLLLLGLALHILRNNGHKH
jgi:hypothetical protein